VKQIASDMSLDSKVAYNQYVGRLVEIAESECSKIEYAVLLMVLDDQSYAEIARLTRLPEASARQHALRAREKLLGHIVLHEVELMGGREDVEKAWQMACKSADSRFTPSPEEVEAWENPQGRAKAFRRAALKMAKWLTLSLIVAELLKHGEVIWKTH
jgi:DNA-binding CsgD family transcriptional regulator